MILGPRDQSRESLATLLRSAGFEVECLSDPDSAMAPLAERAFDLILVDVRLPGRGAEDIASRLRRNTTVSRTRLVAVSSNPFPGADQIAHRSGFDALLTKPFSEQQLFGLAERLLDIRFDQVAAGERAATDGAGPDWPPELAVDTAQQILHAIDLGDVGSLFQLAEDLAENPVAPGTDVESIALMARLFDFEGLQRLSDRLAARQ